MLAFNVGVFANFIAGFIFVLGAIIIKFLLKVIPSSALFGALAGGAIVFLVLNPLILFTNENWHTPYEVNVSEVINSYCEILLLSIINSSKTVFAFCPKEYINASSLSSDGFKHHNPENQLLRRHRNIPSISRFCQIYNHSPQNLYTQQI